MLSSDLPWLKPRCLLEVEPDALLHLSFLGFMLLCITVGPKHPAYKINSNCLSAKQQYFHKRIPFSVVPIGETCGNEFSYELSLKAGFLLGRKCPSPRAQMTCSLLTVVGSPTLSPVRALLWSIVLIPVLTGVVPHGRQAGRPLMRWLCSTVPDCWAHLKWGPGGCTGRFVFLTISLCFSHTWGGHCLPPLASQSHLLRPNFLGDDAAERAPGFCLFTKDRCR